MSLAGLKKQFNKANQYVSEKMGACEGTKFTGEYHEMEKKTDAVIELVDDLLNKTKEYLQPNPATRAKLTISSKVATSRAHMYAQPEGTLGESMIKYGKKLEDTVFSESLNEMGEALKELAETKNALEDNVKQNFLEPLTHLQTKDMKDVQFHRKKLESRRLDFDAKKRKKKSSTISEEELRLAEEKFEESFNLASVGMFNLLQNETEQISQLAAFSEALYEYHSQCATILESLTSRLMEHKKNAAEKPPEEYVPKKLDELHIPADDMEHNVPSPARSPATSPTRHPPNTLQLGAIATPNASPLPSPVRSPARTPVTARGPCCEALFDFDAENPKELEFKEGDIIQLVKKLDENWFEGSLNGKTGMFPVNYVKVVVPFSQ